MVINCSMIKASRRSKSVLKATIMLVLEGSVGTLEVKKDNFEIG
jgi:hypothetical protein